MVFQEKCALVQGTNVSEMEKSEMDPLGPHLQVAKMIFSALTHVSMGFGCLYACGCVISESAMLCSSVWNSKLQGNPTNSLERFHSGEKNGHFLKFKIL